MFEYKTGTCSGKLKKIYYTRVYVKEIEKNQKWNRELEKAEKKTSFSKILSKLKKRTAKETEKKGKKIIGYCTHAEKKKHERRGKVDRR